MPRSFEESFCAKTGCSPDAFERMVLWRGIHRRALPIAWVLWISNRGYFDLELQSIRSIGMATSWRELRSELDWYRSECRKRGRPRRYLAVRLSSGRLTRLFKTTFTEHAA